MSDTNLTQDMVACPVTSYQSATVCVPVTVTPFGVAQNTATRCCGKAVITSGASTCSGIRNGSCSFTVSQNVCVAVPVAFGANAVAGEAYVDCGGVSDVDCDCNAIDSTPAINVEA